MKNFARILLVTTMTAMLFAGCGKTDSASSDVATDTTAVTDQIEEAVEDTVEEEAEAAEAAVEEASAMTFEEYVNSDASVKAQLDEVADQMSMNISAEGNSLVYEYTLDMEVSDDQKDALAEQFDSALAEQASTFEDMKSQLEAETGVSGISIVINYLDSNGSLVYSTTF